MRNISDRERVEAEVEELTRLLVELGRRRSLRDPIATAMEELQFTPAQVHTLIWLGFEGELTMGELARRVGITEKTITGVVDRLEREGLLARGRGGQDRRVVKVTLTRKGTASQRKLQKGMHSKLTDLMTKLDAEDRRALLRIFEKVLDRMGSPSEAAAKTGEEEV